MKPTDRKAFQSLLTDAMAFYRQDVSTFALSVWWEACSGFEMEQVTKAFTAHAMDPERGQFAPKPADVVRLLQGTHVDRSLVAWGKVLDAIQRVGGYESVAFDDPAIHAAIEDLGGWPLMCSGEMKDLPFLQKRFCDAHKAYSLRPGTPYPPVLTGRFEAGNRIAGLPIAAPTLIGSREAALKVIAGGSTAGRTEKLALDALPRPLLEVQPRHKEA
jgi:hypothetical protein